ncbi:DUF4262 domain-containing protein [Blastococcus sp. SYSU DS0973]
MTIDPQTLAWLDQEDSRLAQTVRAHRVAVQYVMRGEESDEPPFGYTVGLFGVGHPELVVVGVGHGTACAVLDDVAGLVLGGRNLVPGEVITDGGAGLLTVEELPKPGEVLSAPTASTSAPTSTRCPPTSSPGRTRVAASRGSRAGPARRSASRGRAAGVREAAQSRPRSRRSLATCPVALTL